MKLVLRAIAVLSLAVVGLATPADAAPAPSPECGVPITTSVRLRQDLHCGLVVAADNVVINLDGHTLSGPGSGTSSGGITFVTSDPLNDFEVSGLTLKNGTIRGFGAAVAGAAGGGYAPVGIPGVILKDATFNNLKVLNNGVGLDIRFGAHEVRNSTFSENSDAIGIGEGSSNITIVGNEFAHNEYGVHNFENDRGVLRGNSFHDNQFGVRLTVSWNWTIQGNDFRHNDVGIFSFDGQGNYSRNAITQNRVGIDLIYSGSPRGPLTIDRNEMTGNGAAGILARYNLTGDVVFSANKVSGNGFDPVGTTNASGQLVNDGIHINPTGLCGCSPAPTTTGPLTFTKNVVTDNADLGIELPTMPGVIDGGRNRGSGNGNPLQCVVVGCA